MIKGALYNGKPQACGFDYATVIEVINDIRYHPQEIKGVRDWASVEAHCLVYFWNGEEADNSIRRTLTWMNAQEFHELLEMEYDLITAGGVNENALQAKIYWEIEE
jgi:hypothetical protein